MEFLVFQLYGPLAAWGEIAVGEHRWSGLHPGKSAILGLLAAALGIRRHETAALAPLADGYGYAVQVQLPGELLRDYHTTQVPERVGKRRFHTRRDELLHDTLGTILSQRDYRMDGLWRVALWAREGAPYSLAQLAEALQRPRLAPYLGRKSCPLALPMNPQVMTEAGTLRQALEDYPNSPLLPEPGTRWDGTLFWEELSPEQAGVGAPMLHVRRDRPLDRTRWQFTTREEFSAATQPKEGES